MIRIDRFRNFGVIAHIDSGKTTVSERILFLTGRIHAMGDVHDGNTALDFDPIEREKGITIQAAVTSVTWRDHQFNLIDTPGHVDFTAEVERSCRVLDGAVAVFCGVAGVQAQSETVWRQAARYGVPCLVFINKADRAGADVDRVIAQLRDRLGARPVVVTYPLGIAGTLEGVVDVIHRRVHRFGLAGDRRAWTQSELPDAERDRCEAYRRQLVEAVALTSEALFARWAADGDLAPLDLIGGLRAAVRARSLHPVLCGAALATIGIQPLMDAIVDLLPSPAEARPVIARVDDDDDGAALTPDAGGSLRALVFKLVSTAHGELAFCRVYQGTLRTGDHLWCPNRGKPERVARLVKLHGDEYTTVDQVGPGDLCAVVGIRHACTGDTLCPEADPAILDGIAFAEPVMGMAVETLAGGDQEALGLALARLAREDPTFHRHVDAETGQLVISGMGELHLEIIARRLVERYRVPVRLGAPEVTRRQRITQNVRQRGRYVRQNSGPGQYGDVVLDIRPQTDAEAAAGDEVNFVAALKGGAVDRCYFSAIEDGVRAELARGGVSAGVRIVGVHVALVDGSMHVQDSNERAFAAAGALAIREALPALGLEMLEPWMRLVVECPADHAGAVIGSVNAKRGRISEVVESDGQVTVHGSAPLAKLFGYPVLVRSLTQGRGVCVMEPDGFRHSG